MFTCCDTTTEDGWGTIVDCTKGGKTEGIPANQMLALLQKIRRGEKDTNPTIEIAG